jgi:hypothetical protein
MRRLLFWTLSCVALSAFVGCEDAWHVPTQQVTGRVSVNGKAPEGAVVQLVSAGEPVDQRNSRPYGVVQSDGTYTLRTYEPGDGAPIGEYKFLIHWPVDRTQPSTFDRLGHEYDDPATSQFTVSVVEGQSELAPIAIEKAKVTMSPPKTDKPSPFDVD